MVAGAGRDNACILGFPDRQPVPGAGDQRLWPLVSGRRGGAPGPGHLSAARVEPALPVYVSARCCRNACVGEPSRASRVTVGILLANSLSWVACILLSVWLATGSRLQRHPLIVIVPSLSVVVLVYNVYLLGQPNLASWLFCWEHLPVFDWAVRSRPALS